MLISSLWIGVIDLMGAYMSNHGLFNLVFGFLFPPMAIFLYYWSFSFLITSKSLYRVFSVLAYSSVLIIIGYVIFVHGLQKTGIDESNINYGVSVPAILSMAMLVELDITLNDKQKSFRGTQLINRGWLLYYSIGYLIWVTRGLVSDLVSIEDRDAVKLLMESIFTSGYVFLAVFTLVAVWKTNLTTEWRRQISQM